ncbi:MAG TPA: ATP-binding protein [Thermoanaerobaculaceae bacterium]|nr:ATP-binding protein [Thermoanaerobaculaceae bacterium]HPS78842.1 ATP-binding protein [Thermoanaerobaculaceae bacterium]
MRTLFLRIFLWFWLAMAVVAAVLVVSSPMLTRSRPSLEHWQRSAESALRGRAEHLVEILQREGVGAFREEAARRDEGRPHQVFILDPQGRELTGREAPPEAVALARRAIESGQTELERSGLLHLAASPATDPQGHPLVLVQTFRPPPSLVDLLEPRVLAPRLLVLLLVTGALCFWLARHLSSPVTTLREATRRLASGDFSARVGSAIGRRRDEISGLARDFDGMAERVVALLGSQQRLVRDVSHELRSPLARLRVALELARRGSGDKAARALDRIEEEADRLNEMIEQLLILSRLETDAGDAERTAFDLAALVAEVVDDASFEAGARSCTVTLDSIGPCELVGSPALLRSAVENVLRNAARYSAEGSEIEVSLAVEPGEGGRRAVIGVRDHGPGVPEELLVQVFQPFFRVDDARDRSTGGSGLGLAIAARAVQLHAGSIEARQAPGGGLLVVISLPLTGTAAPASDPR